MNFSVVNMYEVCDENLEYSVEGKYPDKFSK